MTFLDMVVNLVQLWHPLIKEKTSIGLRKHQENTLMSEIVDFLLANFVTTDNPKNLWIGEIINSGERTYAEWTKRQQSISYLFKEE